VAKCVCDQLRRPLHDLTAGLGDCLRTGGFENQCNSSARVVRSI
jgi:hypothetical protein